MTGSVKVSPEATRWIARIAVGAVASALVTRALGPRPGIVGGVLVAAIHEALDAPVARQLNLLLR